MDFIYIPISLKSPIIILLNLNKAVTPATIITAPIIVLTIFSAIPLLSKDLAKIKSGEPVDFNQFSARVSPAGFKPATAGAEIQCAIQLRHEPKKEDV